MKSTGRMRLVPPFRQLSLLLIHGSAPLDEASWAILGDGKLGLLTLDGTWRHVRVHLVDGRIASASFPGGKARGSKSVLLHLSPSQLREPVDLGELVKRHGATRGNIVWQEFLPTGSGLAHRWYGLRVFTFEPWTLDFPIWSMHVPEGVEARIRLWDDYESPFVNRTMQFNI